MTNSDDNNIDKEIAEGLARAETMLRKQRIQRGVWVLVGFLVLIAVFWGGMQVASKPASAVSPNLSNSTVVKTPVLTTAVNRPLPTLTLTPEVAYPVNWVLAYAKDGENGKVTAFNPTTQEKVLLDIKENVDSPIWVPAKQAFFFHTDYGYFTRKPLVGYEYKNTKFSAVYSGISTTSDPISNNVDTFFYYDNEGAGGLFISHIIGVGQIVTSFHDMGRGVYRGGCSNKWVNNGATDTYERTEHGADFIAISPTSKKIAYKLSSWVKVYRCDSYTYHTENSVSKIIFHDLVGLTQNVVTCDQFLYWTRGEELLVCQNGTFDASGGKKENPYPELDTYAVKNAIWSYALTKMAFISNGDIFIFDPDSKKVSQITTQGGFVNFMWTPKDDYILGANGDIYLINVVTNQAEQITDTPEQEISVSWMP